LASFLWATHPILVTGECHLTITELLGWPFANLLKNDTAQPQQIRFLTQNRK